jgi:hypothetical protein
MTWTGKWRNEYGSTVEIEDDSNNQIVGVFRTALEESGFYGLAINVFGVHHGDCISFAGCGPTKAGAAIVSYTGLLRGGKMETMWLMAADSHLAAAEQGGPAELKKQSWWRAVTVNRDTFERDS